MYETLRLMLKRITDIFFRGLLTLLPIVITFYLIYAGILILENLLGQFLHNLMGNAYIPGLGLLSTIIFIFVFGLLLTHFISKSIWEQIEKRLTQVPLIKALYLPLKDLMGLFGGDGQKELKSVVMVELANGVHVVGLVTRDHFNDVQGIQDPNIVGAFDQKVAVYIPLSYALGGYTLLINKSQTRKINIPVEKALSLAITGWVKSNAQGEKNV
jgi:uncharacterized membrane protein